MSRDFAILVILADARAGLSLYLQRPRDEKLVAGIEPIAEKYAQVVPLLQRVSELLPAKQPWEERPLDAEVLPEATSLLRRAAEAEESAMQDIARVLGRK